MPTGTLRLRDKAYNGVHRFLFTIKKDGVIWTGIDSVLATFEKPDGETVIERAMLLQSDVAGTWYYDSVSGDLNEVGYWNMTIQVTDGSIVIEYPYEIGFRVTNQPGR